MATKTRKASKKIVKTNKTAVPAKTNLLFTGSIEATKVLRRRMDAFKNCIAFAWCIINENRNTVTYANSYGQKIDETMPRASFDPAVYTFPIKESVIAKKLEQYQEVEDRQEWPTWIIPAAGKRTRKTK